MKSFLRYCKEFVANKNVGGNTLSICIGNQASDLDSIVSSIVFSYAQYKRDKITSIPVINIPADEYSLRTDATWFLEKFGINGDDLIFYHQNSTLMEVVERFGKENSLQVILTDHNKLTPEQEPVLGKFVYQIVDHHVDEKCYDIPSERRIIDLIASSCTLVSELMSDELLREDRDCCEALLGTILLDTMNLDPKYKKVTPRDEKQAIRLVSLLNFEQKQRDELFEKLFFERFNVSNLNSQDLLRGDYKEWKMGNLLVGIATAKRSLKEWIEKDSSLESEFKKFYETKKLDILYVMCAYSDEANEFKRELAIYTPNQKLLNDSVDYLVQQGSSVLDLTQWKAEQDTEKTKYFVQHNMASSRKMLQPLLSKFYSSC